MFWNILPTTRTLVRSRRILNCIVLPSLLLLVSQAACVAQTTVTPEQLTFFETEVRPLLAAHCYECHSAQSKKIQASLRVDSLHGMLRGGDSGPIVTPGKLDESSLISAVRYEDFEMPPSGKLSDDQIATLEKWVTMGAPWPDEPEPSLDAAPIPFDWKQRAQEHWCWQPISSPTPPVVKDTQWPANPIDQFVMQGLESAKLTPARDADRRSLLRRVYLDLIGLPPTPKQLHAFLQDDSAKAYDNVVDALLRSPHFGEKWARHWLDLVRYGETLGHEFDYPLHHAYQYRDYVIRAFNADVPFDQFAHEHVAGDLIAQPRMHPTDAFNESIIGTGFWYLGEACHSPTDVRQDEADRIDNQIDVFSKTFLGLTVACARCHDHKFDPIPTADYYALSGFIQSSRRQEALLDPHGKIRAHKEKLKSLNQQLGDAWLDAKPHMRASDAKLKTAIEQELASTDEDTIKALQQPTHWLHAIAKLRDSDNWKKDSSTLRNELAQQVTQAQQQLAKTELFADFRNHDLSDWYVTGEAFADRPTEFGDQQLTLEHTSFAPVGAAHSGQYGSKLQGVLRSPTFVLPKKRIHYKLRAKNARLRLIVDGYTMDEFNALLFGEAQKKNVNTQGRSTWVTQSRDLYHYVGHRAHLEIIDHNDGFAALEQIRFSDDANPIDPPHPLNITVLDSAPDSYESMASAYVSSMQGTIATFRAGDASNEQIKVVNWLIAAGAIETPRPAAELAATIRTTNTSTPLPMRVIALQDGDAEEEYVFVRGSHKLRGKPAPRRMLVAIAGEAQQPDAKHSGRLKLAQQLTARSNPLTARVAVNRLWHHLFGRGIVPTVDDFGKMGQAPSHPELLDWLAHDFVNEKQWSQKEMIRQIVLSRTYRMSGQATANAQTIAEADPQNALLHRAPTRRLSGEAIRDSLLQLSGSLDTTQFGPSVPIHLTSFMEGRGRPGSSGPRDGAGRRSLYIEIRRNFLGPMMMAFDRPSPFSTMGRRSNSNVPAQSLMLMNDPFVVEQAHGWAERVLKDADNEEERLTLLFEMAFSRPPSPAQRKRCSDFLAANSDAPQKSWHDLCHMLINMKPFIYVN